MTPRDLLRLVRPNASDEELQLLGFGTSTSAICHKRFGIGMRKMAQAHEAKLTRGVGENILIIGPSGVGKSFLTEAYEKNFPRCSELGRTTIPVVKVTVPPVPTSKSLAEAILIELGYLRAGVGTGPQKTFLIHEMFKRAGVELLILDEFHHLLYGPTSRSFRDATDWLKNLISLTKVAVVGCGVLEAESVVDGNEQLRRRFSSRFEMTPFAFEEPNDFLEFRSILKLLQAGLPFPADPPLHEANMARRIHVASYGLLDYVIKVFNGAVCAASEAQQKNIGLEVLAAGFRDQVWRMVPDRLNPFHPESPLRPLDRPGECFHRYTTASSALPILQKGMRR